MHKLMTSNAENKPTLSRAFRAVPHTLFCHQVQTVLVKRPTQQRAAVLLTISHSAIEMLDRVALNKQTKSFKCAENHVYPHLRVDPAK